MLTTVSVVVEASYELAGGERAIEAFAGNEEGLSLPAGATISRPDEL